MIKSVYFTQDQVKENLSVAEMSAALQQKKGLLWVNLEAPEPAEIDQVLRDTFNFHPLAIEDCQNDGYQPPKVDDFGTYIFIIAHGINLQPDISLLQTNELDLFLGDHYLVTCFRSEDMPPVRAVWKLLPKDERLHLNGADFLSYAILDHLVDDYMPLLDKMDEEIEWLEDQVLATPTSQVMERVLRLKHDIMTMRRIIAPQREVMNRLSRDEFTQIDRLRRIYYRDIYDHLVRIYDLTESVRDIVSGTLDIYLSSNSLRLNEIMKALTIVSTIFLPLSFLAGVFGMNFKFMPELSWKYGYLAAWGLFVLIAAGMAIFFRNRRWF